MLADIPKTVEATGKSFIGSSKSSVSRTWKQLYRNKLGRASTTFLGTRLRGSDTKSHWCPHNSLKWMVQAIMNYTLNVNKACKRYIVNANYLKVAMTDTSTILSSKCLNGWFLSNLCTCAHTDGGCKSISAHPENFQGLWTFHSRPYCIKQKSANSGPLMTIVGHTIRNCIWT